MGSQFERHSRSAGDSLPVRQAGEGIDDQETLYRKHLLTVTQDLRPNLLPLVGTMHWPVPMTLPRTFLHYSEDGHPPSLAIETPPFTPVFAPVAAKVVHVDSADTTDRRVKQVASITLYNPDSHMTIILKEINATLLPDQLRDTVSIYRHPGITVHAGEHLGYVGKIKMTFFPEEKTEIVDNVLLIMMAYQPRGPSVQFNHQDTVDPLPFFHPLY